MAASSVPTSRSCVWGIVVFIWFLSASLSCASKKLRMAQVVYRHGDRAPEHVYPTYEHKDFWVDGLGQLTQKGMLQEYNMGRFLKTNYITDTGLLNSSYINEQVVCRSTNVDRALMSAQTQLNGLYPPKGRQIWRPNLDWQPIPVKTRPAEEDHLLRPLAHHCPLYNKLNEASEKEPKYQKMQEENTDFLAWLAVQTRQNYSFGAVYQVHDTMVCDQSHNLSLPAWANETVLDKLREISGFTFNWNFVGHEKQKLSGGALIGDIVSHMEAYKKDPSTVKQMYIYSAHDSTLLALQHALGVVGDASIESPPYSSTFMIELHGSDDGSDLSVKMYYRVGQNNTRNVQKLPNCAADCPLDKFISETASVVPDDIEAACLLPTSPMPAGNMTTARPSGTAEHGRGGDGFKIGFIVVLVLLILLIIVVIVVFCWLRKRPQYSEVTKGEPA